MTLREDIQTLKASWAHELKTQSPVHIFQQVIKTLYLCFTLLPVALYVQLRRRVRIGYLYTMHYFFLGLQNIRDQIGFYFDGWRDR